VVGSLNLGWPVVDQSTMTTPGVSHPSPTTVEDFRRVLDERAVQANLAVRNLLRSYGLRMPTGQALADLLRFAKVVGGGAAPRTYMVKKGDTPSGIAAKKLGDAGRWPEIARLNRDIVPDPDEIVPGQVLVILER
jgi:nucleoid-associated protein YgaU